MVDVQASNCEGSELARAVLAGFPSSYAAGDDFRILVVDELVAIAHIAAAVIAFWNLPG